MSLSSCSLRFLVSPNHFIAFFLIFLAFFLFVFDIRLSFFSICFLSTFTFVLKKLLIFRQPFILYTGTCDVLSCFWLAPFHEGSKMISKTSRHYSKFFLVVQVIRYILPYGFSFPISRFTSNVPLLAISLIIRMSLSLFDDMMDLEYQE